MEKWRTLAELLPILAINMTHVRRHDDDPNEAKRHWLRQVAATLAVTLVVGVFSGVASGVLIAYVKFGGIEQQMALNEASTRINTRDIDSLRMSLDRHETRFQHQMR